MPEPSTLRFVQEAPLAFGPWRELKALYKKLESDPSADPELLGALIARLDRTPLVQPPASAEVQLGRLQSIQALAAQGTTLAIAFNRTWNNPHLLLADFAVPDRLKPKKLATVKLAGGNREVRQVLWCGPLIVVVWAVGIQIYEPERDTLKPLAYLSQGNVHVAAQFPYLYVVVKDGLKIFDLRDIHGSGSTLELRGAKQIELGDGFAAVLSEGVGFAWNRMPSAGGLKVLDTRDPKKPTVLGELAIHKPSSLLLDGRCAYVLGAGERDNLLTFHRVELSALSAPQRTGSVELGFAYSYGQTTRAMAVEKGIVTVGAGYQTYLVDAREALPKTLPVPRINHTQSLAAAESWLYVANWSSLSLYSLAYPERPTPYGAPPSARTLGYMKRRARRHLRQCAQTEPKRFVELASAVLGSGETGLDPGRNWIAYELLYGAGKRYEQRSHGRGVLVERQAPRLSLRRREELGASAWDAQPELAGKLYTNSKALWQGRELALKVLRTAGIAVPSAGGVGVATPSLLLTAYGVRELLLSKKLTPELAALGFARASAKQRTKLGEKILAQETDTTWKATFVEGVLRATDPSKLRRFGAVAGFVAQHFPEAIAGTAIIPLVPGLLASGKPALSELAHRAAQNVDEGTLDEWLELLPTVREADREALLQALEAGAVGKDFGTPYELMEYEEPLVRAALWRILAASATSQENLRELWDELLMASAVNEALQTAMGSSYALATLGRAGYTASELSQTLTERPFLVGILDTQAFTSLTQTLPVVATLRLIASAEASVWGRIRDGWVRNLREGLGIAELWSALPEALDNDSTGNLEARVLSDSAITECLLTCEDAPRLLELRNPALGPLLGRWLVRHWPKLDGNDGLLLVAATHSLADVRTPALEIVGRKSLRLPFALRLLECEIPGSIAVGKKWFESSPESELENRALALCDSPVKSVRAYGRAFVREKNLAGEKLALALFEHDEPDMQHFAAEVAGDLPAPGFDRTVLRARHKSRRAKEQVKARQEDAAGEALVDIPTLLALARGSGSKRDAEWALVQLTKRALAGESVEGLRV